jgi:MinD-like ATPase involved in chromosome partitioning or flagellar assembly
VVKDVDERQRPEAGGSDSGEPQVVAVYAGVDGPSRTTVSIGLAAALGAVAPTVLVDADLTSPSVAASLDGDPTRNVAMLAHALAGAEDADTRTWNRALAEELQPLHSASPRAWMLCGLPKPEMHHAFPRGFWRTLTGELRRRFRYVVLDVGAPPGGAEESGLPAALTSADRVLLVAPAHVVGLHHARWALAALRAPHAVPGSRLGLVLDHYDQRFHHAPGEVEWSLQVSVIAVIPHDHAGVQRALSEQRPLVVGRPGGAGRAILELATWIHRGGIAPASVGARPSAPTSLWTSTTRRWSGAALSAAERFGRWSARRKSRTQLALGVVEAPLPGGRTAGATGGG